MTPEALTELVGHLTSADEAARRAAAQTLVTLGAEARSAAPTLVDLAGDEDETVQIAVVEALENLGPPDAATLPALGERLANTPSPEGAYWAATLIGRLEAEAAPATEVLAQTLANHHAASVRERAAWALGKIGPPAIAAKDALEAAANGKSPRLARLAQESLKQIGAG